MSLTWTLLGTLVVVMAGSLGFAMWMLWDIHHAMARSISVLGGIIDTQENRIRELHEADRYRAGELFEAEDRIRELEAAQREGGGK